MIGTISSNKCPGLTTNTSGTASSGRLAPLDVTSTSPAVRSRRARVNATIEQASGLGVWGRAVSVACRRRFIFILAVVVGLERCSQHTHNTPVHNRHRRHRVLFPGNLAHSTRENKTSEKDSHEFAAFSQPTRESHPPLVFWHCWLATGKALGLLKLRIGNPQMFFLWETFGWQSRNWSNL